MLKILLSDWLKLKRTKLIFLSLLGPVGVIMAIAVLYFLYYDEFVKPGADNWAKLVENVHLLLIPTLLLQITLIVSVITNLEHQGRCWKQLCSLPISKFRIYLSKFLWSVVMLLLSGSLTFLGIIVLGYLFQLHANIPWGLVLGEGYNPIVASCSLIAIQLWVSAINSNQLISILVGVAGVLFTLAYKVVPHWIPWVYPYWAGPVSSANPLLFVECGAVFGVAALLIGGILFANKEMKQ